MSLRNLFSGRRASQRPQDNRIRIGQVALPAWMESRHIALTGTTGAGKTVSLRRIVRTLRDRGDVVVCVDAGGELMSEFGSDEDIILSPLDARSQRWDPLQEIETVADLPRLAQSLIPPAHGDGENWAAFARVIVEGLLERVGSVKELEDWIFYHPEYADPEHPGGDSLEELLAGTVAGGAFTPANGRMLMSMLTVMRFALSWIRYASEVTGQPWSARRWAADLDTKPQWIWLPVRADHHEMLSPFVTAVVQQVITQILSLRPSESRRVWLLIDEIGGYKKMASLPLALTQGRKFGLRAVVGFQSVSQIIETYEFQGAQTLLSCFSTMLVLRAPDPDTAKWQSSLLGERERLHRSRTEGDHGDSVAEQLRSEAAVLPSEIARLPDLQGYLRVPGDYPVGKIKLNPPPRPVEVVPPFVAAPWLKRVTPAPARSAAPVSSQPEAQRSAENGAAPDVDPLNF